MKFGVMDISLRSDFARRVRRDPIFLCQLDVVLATRLEPARTASKLVLQFSGSRFFIAPCINFLLIYIHWDHLVS